MDQTEIPVRHEFIAATGYWVRHLRDGGAAPRDDDGGPRRTVALGHRLSDTIPTYLADRLEAFLDEFWTLSQERWPLRGGKATRSAALDRRVESLAETWLRLKRDLLD